MFLSEKQLEEFNSICKKRAIVLTDADGIEFAQKLLSLVKEIYKPIKKQ